MLCAVPIVVCAKPGSHAGFITVCHTLMSCVPNITLIISYCVPNYIVLCANNHFGIFYTIVLCYIFKCSVFFLRTPYFTMFLSNRTGCQKMLGILGPNLCHVPVKMSWVPKTLSLLGLICAMFPSKCPGCQKCLDRCLPKYYSIPFKKYWVPFYYFRSLSV